MKFYDARTSGIAHLQQNRLRSELSILGILIGVASVLCMMAIGDGTQKIIADDIEKLGGPNQVQFWIRPYTYPRGTPKKRTTERYAIADVHAIEAECPDVLYVLTQNRKYPRWATSAQGVQIRSTIEGVTADYAHIIVEEWPVVLSVQWILISVIFSIFMGVIFGIYPAIRAAGMPPIEALRNDT